MTPMPNLPSPKPELLAAIASASAQLEALSSGEHESFLASLPQHHEMCLELEKLQLGPGDRSALAQLIALNNTIMQALDATQDALREQMSNGRQGARVVTAYLR